MTCSTTSTTGTITITRGENRTIRVTVRDTNKALVDLTGAKVWFTVKERIEDVTPLIRKRNLAAGGADAEILILIPQADADKKGKFEIYLLPTDTECLKSGVSYVCDAWVELVGKRYNVVKKRTFVIEDAVTTDFN
jgi:hypothetical protein